MLEDTPKPAEAVSSHHPPDEDRGFLVRLLVGFVVLVGAGCGIAALALGGAGKDVQKAAVPGAPPFANEGIAAPRLEERPGAAVEALREWESAQLESWSLVDREKGTARIPIERAMDLLLERGFPVRTEGEPARPGGK